MLYRDLAFPRAGYVAACAIRRLGEALQLFGGVAEKSFQFLPDRGVVGADRGQHSGMVEVLSECLLQVAALLDDACVGERFQCRISLEFLTDEVEFLQDRNVFLWQFQGLSVSQDLKQRNFKRRNRNHTVERVAVLFPLAGYARITIQKGRHEISLVAGDVAGRFLSRVIPKQGLGNFGVDVRSKRLSQHGGRNRQVQYFQPAAYAGERVREVQVEFTQRNQVQVGRKRNRFLDGVSQ